MSTRRDPRGQRALRLAAGTALCLAISFGLDLPVPMIAPVFGAFLLTMLNQPLSFRAGLGLTLVVTFTTGSGLLLIPLLRYYPVSGVLLIGLCLFLSFRYGWRGGNNLVATFLVVGLAMISAAGVFEFGLAVVVIGALVKGLLVAVLLLGFCHWLFPEPDETQPPPAAPVLPDIEASRMSLRAALVVLPALLLALSDPAYVPIIMKSVSLGRQSCTTSAQGAARELLGSTLLGGALAILFWCALSLFVNLWMFFLWMLLFGLLIARKLYGLSPTRHPPSFWLNTLVTLIILLGQSRISFTWSVVLWSVVLPRQYTKTRLMTSSLEITEIAGAGLPVRVTDSEVMSRDVAIFGIAVKAVYSGVGVSCVLPCARGNRR